MRWPTVSNGESRVDESRVGRAGDPQRVGDISNHCPPPPPPLATFQLSRTVLTAPTRRIHNTLQLTTMSPAPQTPTLVLPAPPPSASTSSPPTLELPSELLLSLHQALDRDGLDSFVISQAGGAGAVQLEDVLNELVPDGE